MAGSANLATVARISEIVAEASVVRVQTDIFTLFRGGDFLMHRVDRLQHLAFERLEVAESLRFCRTKKNEEF